MKKFIIDYSNGITEKIEADSLNEVKKMAVAGMSYTCQPVIIRDNNGHEITRSEWFGVDGNDNDHVLIQFGNSGYYQVWNDDLANL